jgi:hypothetical protein
MCPYLWMALYWGQDTLLVLLLLVASLELAMRGRDGAAGVVLALALVKWNVLLLLPPSLLLLGRRRLFGSFVTVAFAEAGLSLLIVGPSGVADILVSLRDPVADFMGLKMPSLRGLLLNAGLPAALVAVAVVGSAVAFLAWVRRLDFAPAFALAVGASVYLSYHTMFYDVLLFLIPLMVLGPQLRAARFEGLVTLALSPFPFFLSNVYGGWPMAFAGITLAGTLVAVGTLSTLSSRPIATRALDPSV